MLKIASAYTGRAELCAEENEQPVLIGRYFSQITVLMGGGVAESSRWPIHQSISFPPSDPQMAPENMKGRRKKGKMPGVPRKPHAGLEPLFFLASV